MKAKNTVFLDVVSLREQFAHAKRSALITPAEVAAATGLAPGTLNVYRATGRGPQFVKVGPQRVMYRKADVLAWMKQNVRRGAPS